MEVDILLTGAAATAGLLSFTVLWVELFLIEVGVVVAGGVVVGGAADGVVMVVSEISEEIFLQGEMPSVSLEPDNFLQERKFPTSSFKCI